MGAEPVDKLAVMLLEERKHQPLPWRLARVWAARDADMTVRGTDLRLRALADVKLWAWLRYVDKGRTAEQVAEEAIAALAALALEET